MFLRLTLFIPWYLALCVLAPQFVYPLVPCIVCESQCVMVGSMGSNAEIQIDQFSTTQQTNQSNHNTANQSIKC